MRQLPSQELQSRTGSIKLRTGAMGVSAAVLSASMLFAGRAGSQQAVTTTESTQPVLPDAAAALAGAAAEPVLIATFGGEATLPATPLSALLGGATIDPETGAASDLVAIAETGTAAGAAPSYAPLPALSAYPAVSALLTNAHELAQSTEAPADQTGSFWPEDHWRDDGSSGSWLDGLVSLSLSGAAVAMIGGGAWLLWRYINTEPEFDDSIVYLTFEESPCSRVTASDPDADVVYVAPGKDADGDDLTYSIVAHDTDDSALVAIDSETGEVRFINDPLYFSPGDLNRDGAYNFVIEVEDEDGNTATQAVEMTINRSSPNNFSQTDFVQNGGTVCGDEFEITDSSSSPSLFDVAGGMGNDLAHVLTNAVTNFGVDLGAGEDTLFVDETVVGLESVLVDLGSGRDTIDLDAHVLSLVVQNFDADDLIFLDGGVVTTDGAGALDETATANGLSVSIYEPAIATSSAQVFTSEQAAEAALTNTTFGEVVAYHNGEHSFIWVEESSSDTIATTIKLEDYVLSDYSQILVA